jgi:hypothetical protein
MSIHAPIYSFTPELAITEHNSSVKPIPQAIVHALKRKQGVTSSSAQPHCAPVGRLEQLPPGNRKSGTDESKDGVSSQV